MCLTQTATKPTPCLFTATLPIVVVRYVGEWFNMTGYGTIYILGRILSGIFDLGTVLVVFFIGKKFFDKFWPSWLAMLLYACSVLPIQISHYFIVDNFTTFFAMLAFLAAVTVLKREETLYTLVRPSNLGQWLKLNWLGHGALRFLWGDVGFGRRIQD